MMQFPEQKTLCQSSMAYDNILKKHSEQVVSSVAFSHDLTRLTGRSVCNQSIVDIECASRNKIVQCMCCKSSWHLYTHCITTLYSHGDPLMHWWRYSCLLQVGIFCCHTVLPPS